ncbi:MAG: SpoIIE family protein phosphatase, partial [Desulfobulbaceae bacterium]|nr:SpoIIE family protein phosphatase [Desulfobulbaceae bacterium]
IDGLGHGEAAYLPAQKAAEYVRKNHKSDFNAILRGCHKELRGPRGVVMGLVALDLKKSKFVCAGIGNITIRAIGRKPFRFISNAGILGHNICITPHVTEFPYSRGDTLILNTDGISKRFEPEQLDIAELAPQEIAEIAVREYGKDSDDATIVVAREL